MKMPDCGYKMTWEGCHFSSEENGMKTMLLGKGKIKTQKSALFGMFVSIYVFLKLRETN